MVDIPRHLFPVHMGTQTEIKVMIMQRMQQRMERMNEIAPFARLMATDGLTTSASLDVLVEICAELQERLEATEKKLKHFTRLVANLPPLPVDARSSAPRASGTSAEQESLEFDERLFLLLEQLEFSCRTQRVFPYVRLWDTRQQKFGEPIRFLGELVQLSEQNLLKSKNLGRKTLKDIKSLLSDMGLGLGTVITDWPERLANHLASQGGRKER